MSDMWLHPRNDILNIPYQQPPDINHFMWHPPIVPLNHYGQKQEVLRPELLQDYPRRNAYALQHSTSEENSPALQEHAKYQTPQAGQQPIRTPNPHDQGSELNHDGLQSLTNPSHFYHGRKQNNFMDFYTSQPQTSIVNHNGMHLRTVNMNNHTNQHWTNTTNPHMDQQWTNTVNHHTIRQLNYNFSHHAGENLANNLNRHSGKNPVTQQQKDMAQNPVQNLLNNPNYYTGRQQGLRQKEEPTNRYIRNKQNVDVINQTRNTLTEYSRPHYKGYKPENNTHLDAKARTGNPLHYDSSQQTDSPLRKDSSQQTETPVRRHKSQQTDNPEHHNISQKTQISVSQGSEQQRKNSIWNDSSEQTEDQENHYSNQQRKGSGSKDLSFKAKAEKLNPVCRSSEETKGKLKNNDSGKHPKNCTYRDKGKQINSPVTHDTAEPAQQQKTKTPMNSVKQRMNSPSHQNFRQKPKISEFNLGQQAAEISNTRGQESKLPGHHHEDQRPKAYHNKGWREWRHPLPIPEQHMRSYFTHQNMWRHPPLAGLQNIWEHWPSL